MTSLDAVQVFGGDVYWIEGGAAGDLLRRWEHATGAVSDALPEVDVGTSIYGYGGGAYAVTPDGVFASDRQTSAIVHQAPGAARVERVIEDGWWYGDLHWVPSARVLLAVRENGASAEVVAVDPARHEVRVLASGEDFYAAPRASPDGRSLAWLSWNAPAMPWDRTTLWVAPFANTTAARQVITGDESLFCPQWSPDGTLHVVSDRTGWWNLYRVTGNRLSPVITAEAELGVAQWELGYATYAFLDDDNLAVLSQCGTRNQLSVGPVGDSHQVGDRYTSVKPYLSADAGRLAYIGASATQEPTVITVDPGSTHPRELTPARSDSTAHPEPFDFRARDGALVHGLYWAPAAVSRDRPLIIRAHPGPTANATGRLDDYVRFFTHHGYAIADIDYRGSTGYGRDYRLALRGQWGIADAHDCIDAARHLISLGHANPDRVMITGASAGGYTALRALMDDDTPFAAGTARSDLIDPPTWRTTVPRFQAHHTDHLIGPWPATADSYHARSVLHHADRLRRPVLLIHGDVDPITPASSTAQLAAALSRAGTPHLHLTLSGEGHTLSDAAAARALSVELRHYAGLTPA